VYVYTKLASSDRRPAKTGLLRKEAAMCMHIWQPEPPEFALFLGAARLGGAAGTARAAACDGAAGDVELLEPPACEYKCRQRFMHICFYICFYRNDILVKR
jgi:hypothetical protein